MYEVEPLLRADKREQQGRRELERELRKEEREYKSFGRKENHQDWTYLPLRAERKEEY